MSTSTSSSTTLSRMIPANLCSEEDVSTSTSSSATLWRQFSAKTISEDDVSTPTSSSSTGFWRNQKSGNIQVPPTGLYGTAVFLEASQEASRNIVPHCRAFHGSYLYLGDRFRIPHSLFTGGAAAETRFRLLYVNRRTALVKGRGGSRPCGRPSFCALRKTPTHRAVVFLLICRILFYWCRKPPPVEEKTR